MCFYNSEDQKNDKLFVQEKKAAAGFGVGSARG
jgi:hypothetical protein